MRKLSMFGPLCAVGLKLNILIIPWHVRAGLTSAADQQHLEDQIVCSRDSAEASWF